MIRERLFYFAGCVKDVVAWLAATTGGLRHKPFALALLVQATVGSAGSEFIVPDDLGCHCSGETIVFTCAPMGLGTTLWDGSAFVCPQNGIIMVHDDRFRDMTDVKVTCGTGVTGMTAGITGIESGPGNATYTSKVMIRLADNFQNKTVICNHRADTGSIIIGNATLKIPELKAAPSHASLAENTLTLDYPPVIFPGCDRIPDELAISAVCQGEPVNCQNTGSAQPGSQWQCADTGALATARESGEACEFRMDVLNFCNNGNKHLMGSPVIIRPALVQAEGTLARVRQQLDAVPAASSPQAITSASQRQPVAFYYVHSCLPEGNSFSDGEPAGLCNREFTREPNYLIIRSCRLSSDPEDTEALQIKAGLNPENGEMASCPPAAPDPDHTLATLDSSCPSGELSLRYLPSDNEYNEPAVTLLLPGALYEQHIDNTLVIEFAGSGENHRGELMLRNNCDHCDPVLTLHGFQYRVDSSSAAESETAGSSRLQVTVQYSDCTSGGPLWFSFRPSVNHNPAVNNSDNNEGSIQVAPPEILSIGNGQATLVLNAIVPPDSSQTTLDGHLTAYQTVNFTHGNDTGSNLYKHSLPVSFCLSGCGGLSGGQVAGVTLGVMGTIAAVGASVVTGVICYYKHRRPQESLPPKVTETILTTAAAASGAASEAASEAASTAYDGVAGGFGWALNKLSSMWSKN